VRRHHARPSRRRRPTRFVIAAVAAVAGIGLALVATAPRATDLGTAGAQPAAVAGLEPTAVATAEAAPVAPSAGPLARGDTLALPVGRPRYFAGPAEPPVSNPPLVTVEPAQSPTVTPASELTGYRWPLAGPRMTQPFGPSPFGDYIVDGTSFHDGIDLATVCGARIVAAHDGTVLAAGRHFDQFIGWIGDLRPYFRRLESGHLWSELPNVVVIDDGNGYRSLYAHFERLVVKPGQRVRAGRLLGYEGATGHATGCHLHYGLFNPAETARFGLAADVAKRMKLPRAEIARIDPLLVLPPRRGLNAPAFRAPDLDPSH
jgi:murein DD-endopeptidase MepM/ murein hydrolase activator NlpD